MHPPIDITHQNTPKFTTAAMTTRRSQKDHNLVSLPCITHGRDGRRPIDTNTNSMPSVNTHSPTSHKHQRRKQHHSSSLNTINIDTTLNENANGYIRKREQNKAARCHGAQLLRKGRDANSLGERINHLYNVNRHPPQEIHRFSSTQATRSFLSTQASTYTYRKLQTTTTFARLLEMPPNMAVIFFADSQLS